MAKRASMREGPLADLFRATDEGIEPGDIQISANGVNGANGNGSHGEPATGQHTALVEPNEVEVREPEAPVHVEVEPDPEIVESTQEADVDVNVHVEVEVEEPAGVGDIEVAVAGRDHLISMKRARGRPVDLEDLAVLAQEAD